MFDFTGSTLSQFHHHCLSNEREGSHVDTTTQKSHKECRCDKPPVTKGLPYVALWTNLMPNIGDPKKPMESTRRGGFWERPYWHEGYGSNTSSDHVQQFWTVLSLQSVSRIKWILINYSDLCGHKWIVSKGCSYGQSNKFRKQTLIHIFPFQHLQTTIRGIFPHHF